MDTQTLVDDHIESGQKFVTLLVHNKFDVTAACWVRTSDEENLYLYIASKNVDTMGLAGAYREAYRLLECLDNPWLSPSQIKLVRSDNPLVADVQESQRRLGVASPIVSRRPLIGDIGTQEVYIYATVDPEKTWVRQAFTVTYVRQTDTNTWQATVTPGELFRGLRPKGAVSYTTASYQGETPEDQRFALVSVLVEVDPKFDDKSLLNQPHIRQMLVEQARTMADEMFRSRHPDAIILHEADDE